MTATRRILRASIVLAVAVLAVPSAVYASVVSDAIAPHAKPSASCPLTGEKSKASVVTRPAVAVKVDNSEEARPQSGLDKADVVFESLVEGGMTRLTAVYHCGSASSVGPVRSARYDDGEMVDAMTSLLAFSGSNNPVAKNLDTWGVFAVDEESGAGAMERDEDLDEPYNLFADTEALRSIATAKGVKAPARIVFGSMPPGSARTSVVELKFSDTTEVGYRWTKHGWARSQDGDASKSGGSRVYVDNVLVQVVDVAESETIVDENGAGSPMMSLTGKGKAYLFRNGQALTGTWKDGGDGAPKFRTKKGKKPFAFTTGNTWIELVPSAAGELTGKVAYH